MVLFQCKPESGSKPQALEHKQIKWISPEDLNTLDWLEADYQILPQLLHELTNPET